jgi:hypothetical protein
MDTHIMTPPVTEHQLCRWLGGAKPGDQFQYHRGFLAVDVSANGHLPERKRKQLLAVARRATWAADNELVHLIQRRYGVDDYAYFIEAKARPKLERKSILEVIEGDPDRGTNGGRLTR